ncbi:MAG: hypothetical protein ACPGR8_06420 [Limisphaerales bacterium]
MSDQASGKPAAKAKALQEKLSPDQITLDVERETPLSQASRFESNVPDEQFPTAGLSAKDKRDELMSMKLGTTDQRGVTPFGQMRAKDSDFEWARKKALAAEKANFEQWFAQHFDRMSPAQKKRAKELFPGFYAERQKLLKKQSANLYDLARIKLNGIDSYEDLFKMYMAQTGRLDVGPLNRLLNPEAQRPDDRRRAFRRGLLNPFRLAGNYGTEDRAVNRDQWDPRTQGAEGDIDIGEDVGFPPMANFDDAGGAGWMQYLRQ